MADQPDTRTRLVNTATTLLARDGYAGLAINELLREAGATSGSLYHHFPGGKEELAATAIREAGEAARAGMAALVDQLPLGDAIVAFFSIAGAGIEQSQWRLGCPVGTPAADGVGAGVQVAEAVRASFDSWIEVLSGALVAEGVPRAAARDLAQWAVLTYEGAVLLTRARRDGSVMQAAAARLAAEVGRSLPA